MSEGNENTQHFFPGGTIQNKAPRKGTTGVVFWNLLQLYWVYSSAYKQVINILV